MNHHNVCSNAKSSLPIASKSPASRCVIAGLSALFFALAAPNLPAASQTVTAVSAGDKNGLFIKSDFTLWGTGNNYQNPGTLGLGANSTLVYAAPPVQIPAAGPVVSAATSGGHSLFLTSNGTLYGMGDNTFGQLGLGNTTTFLDPTPIATNVVAFTTGPYDTLFTKTDGSLWGMGYNQFGELGTGVDMNNSTVATNIPVQILPSDSNIAAISMGDIYSVFIKNDHTLWGMGDNSSGELGLGNATSQFDTPVQIDSGVIAVSAGYNHTLYVKSGGSLWAMGDEFLGQLGDGFTIGNVFTPEEILSANVTAVSASHSGTYFSLFLTANGTLYGMGDGEYGQLGDGGAIGGYFSNIPVAISTNVTAISAGMWQTLYIDKAGNLWGTGRNAERELGDPLGEDISTPEIVVGVSANVTSPVANSTVSIGGNATFSASVTGTGLLYQWQFSNNGGSSWNNFSDGTVSGVTYAGSVSSTLHISNVIINMSGLMFRCQVTATGNAAIFTNAATLTIQGVAPKITTQPVSVAAPYVHAEADFSIIATGTPTPAFVWQLKHGTSSTFSNVSLNDGVHYPPNGFPTPPGMIIPDVTSTMNGDQYRCFVYNSAGNVTSNTVTLTIGTTKPTAPAIITQPANSTVIAGSTATFTVAYTGTSPTLHWQRAAAGSTVFANLTDNANITGSQTFQLSVANATLVQSGSLYRCVLANSVKSVTSAAAKLIVQPSALTAGSLGVSLAATQSDGGVTYVLANQSVTFSVSATGPGTVTYLWYQGTSLVATTTVGNYTIKKFVQANSSNYSVTIKSVSTMGTVTLTKGPSNIQLGIPPKILASPANQTVGSGSSTTFTIAFTAAPSTVQWQSSTDGKNWSNLANGGAYSGVNTGQLTVTASPSLSGLKYQAVVHNIFNTAVSKPASLTVTPPPPAFVGNYAITSMTLNYIGNHSLSLSTAAQNFSLSINSTGLAGVSTKVASTILSYVGAGTAITLKPTSSNTTDYSATLSGNANVTILSVSDTVTITNGTVVAHLTNSGVLTIVANINGTSKVLGKVSNLGLTIILNKSVPAMVSLSPAESQAVQVRTRETGAAPASRFMFAAWSSPPIFTRPSPS